MPAAVSDYPCCTEAVLLERGPDCVTPQTLFLARAAPSAVHATQAVTNRAHACTIRIAALRTPKRRLLGIGGCAARPILLSTAPTLTTVGLSGVW
jgi:hypothetical protein